MTVDSHAPLTLSSGHMGPARSLDHLAGFLRVIRVPRADIRAMVERAPAGTDRAMAAAERPTWLERGAAPGAGVNHLGSLPGAVLRLYLGTAAGETGTDPTAAQALQAIAAGRARLVEEAIADFRDGRLASAIMLGIAQIDGIAADVPPTPGAAWPFLIDDDRDWDDAASVLAATTLAAHPGSLAVVGELMRTSRPDTNVTTRLHRHGVMHGRDLGFDTPQNAARVFALLSALIAWATPIADARRSQ